MGFELVIQALGRAGLSIRDIAARTGVPRTTVQRALKGSPLKRDIPVIHLPWPVRCPGCGVAEEHVTACPECGAFLVLHPEGQGQGQACAEGWDLSQLRKGK